MRTLIPAGLALLSVAALSGCGRPPAPPTTVASPQASASAASVAPTVSPTPVPLEQACAPLVDQMTAEERAGQLFMVGKSATSMPDASYADMLQKTKTGQVLLLENTGAGVKGVKKLSDELRKASPTVAGAKVLIAADQEGGLVQRLKGEGFDVIPSAEEQAAIPEPELQAKAALWGKQLRDAGIDVDLAPVTDSVPADLKEANAPIGALRRGYGPDPAAITPKSNAFIKGMTEAGVATSVKHFPNLGHVTGNTDLKNNVTDSTTTRDDVALQPFKEGVNAGSEMVMVSTAIYAKIDPKTPATFSKVIITDMIRKDMGFEGVVISDDMGAAKQVAGYLPGDRAVRFLAAGGDVVINGDPSLQKDMHDAVVKKMFADTEFNDEVKKKVARVLAMKARHGAVTCPTTTGTPGAKTAAPTATPIPAGTPATPAGTPATTTPGATPVGTPAGTPSAAATPGTPARSGLPSVPPAVN